MAQSPLVVTRDRSGAICLLLNRPERRNAIDEATALSLLAELDRDTRSVVLLGSTTPAIFCAGADLKIPDAERARCSDLLYQCFDRMIRRPGPVIAVIEGPAVGGGAQLATATDLRIAGRHARFRWVGPGHGLAVGAWILPALVGRGMALDLTLTGRWVDARQARRAGLVTGVHADPWQAARELASAIAELDPEAVARVKTIATRSELCERLAAERAANAQWAGAIGPQAAR